MPAVDICFSPDLLPLYDLRGRVAVIVDVLRASTTIVTALVAGVTHVFPVAGLDECAALGAQGCLTAAERDGVPAAGYDFGNSPFGFLDPARPVRGRALAISTTNGTQALRRSLAAEAVVIGGFVNLAAVVGFVQQQQQRDVLVVCAGWKGQFCLEDSLFGGALAARLQPLGFEVQHSDSTLAALHLWHQAAPDLAGFLLESAAVRRLNALEAHEDFLFCVKIDTYADALPMLQNDRLVLK